MNWECSKIAAPVGPLEELYYQVTKPCRLIAAEIIDRSAPCTATLTIAPVGSTRARGGVCLVQGATNGLGLSLYWTGDVQLTVGEQVMALFNDVVAGDVISMTLKVVDV